MNKIRYLYEFKGLLTITENDKLFKIKNQRIVSDFEKIYVNDELYLGSELQEADEIVFNEEKIIYFNNFLLSSFKLPLNELKIEYQTLKERKPYVGKYNDLAIIPKLEIDLKRVSLRPLNRNVSIISFLPMIMMSLASLAVVLLNIYQKNQTIVIKDNIQQLLLPLVMLASTLVLQPLIRFQDKRKIVKDNNRLIKDYQKYLEKKADAVKNFKRENDNYLNNIYLDQSILNDKIQNNNFFQYKKDNEEFLVISLGKGNIDLNNLKIKNSNNEDNEIGKLSKEFVIKSTKANIGPIILDLKEDDYSTFVIKENNFNYLELIIFQIFVTIWPNDLKTAVLIEEKYLQRFSYLLDIRHLYYDSLIHLFKKDEGRYKDADLLIVIGRNFNPKVSEKQKVITFVENIEDVPSNTNALITIQDKTGIIKRNDSLKEFHFNKEEINIREYFKRIYNYSYPQANDINTIIPLTDLYPIDFSPNTLKAVIGRNNQGVVTLDLDETKDGPHGLVVGMTGSGKSELLLTLVLSLALNYSPNYLNFVIIDFKGGGIVNILNNKERRLKHLVSSLTNIDSINFERILVSFKNEIIKRQKLFKKASDISGENITNIKEYLMLLKRGIIKEIIPHLIIILDEFAEIKKEHNEVIEEFLSISRVGRSLGIHLILCTQRAQGVIDEEIKSNAGFKICLKVNSKEDSREVIESDDAVNIKEKGGFYLLTNDYFLYGKSAYTNADIYKSYLRKTELLNENLETIDRIYLKTNSKAVTEATKIIEVLNKRYSNLNLDNQRLWLKPLNNPQRNEKSNNNSYSFGIVDDYQNKCQYPAEFSCLTNNLVISNDKNKKEKHLSNCLNDLNNKDIDVYLLNFSKYKFKGNLIEINEKNEYELGYIENLLTSGKDRFIKSTLIIITDLKSFIAYYDNNEFLKRAIEQAENYNYRFLIYANASADYSYSFSLLFEHLAYIGDLKSDEILNIFSKAYRSDSINDGLIENTELKEFKLYEEEYIKTERKIESVIKYIPAKRILKSLNNRYLLGYTLDFADEFYLDLNIETKVIMTSYDEDLLTDLKNIFHKYEQIIFVNADELRIYKREIRTSIVLFYGSGITDNYDLNSGIRDDLQDDEMYYIYKKQKVRIKYFNEWNKY